MLTILAGEQHSAAALDAHDGVVAEPKRAADLGVQFGECCTSTGYVVRRPGVKDPLLGVAVLLLCSELDEDLPLLKPHRSAGCGPSSRAPLA